MILKRKPQHFDRRGDFDVLVADDEVQGAGALLAGRCFWAWGRRRRSGSLVWWAFVFFVVHVERANDEELAG